MRAAGARYAPGSPARSDARSRVGDRMPEWPARQWSGWPRPPVMQKAGASAPAFVQQLCRGLLNRDRSLHARRDMRRADIVVLARRNIRERHLILLVRIEQHRAREIGNLVR